MVQRVKSLSAMWETWVWSLGWEDLLEKEISNHSSILAWRIPKDRGAWWATVHGVANRHDWVTSHSRSPVPRAAISSHLPQQDYRWNIVSEQSYDLWQVYRKQTSFGLGSRAWNRLKLAQNWLRNRKSKAQERNHLGGKRHLCKVIYSNKY